MVVDLLIMDSGYEGRIVKAELKDGLITYKDKSWYADKSIPIIIKNLFGNKSFYIVKWDSAVPSSLNQVKNLVEGKEPIDKDASRDVKPKFSDTKDFDPQLIRKMLDAKILGGMLKTKRGGGIGIGQNVFIMLAIGIAIGFIAMQVLQKFGLIKI